MFAVALLNLASAPEAEAQKLAGDLGVTVFEAGQLVRGTLPSIILKTPDRARALALMEKLRARGHEAAACDVSLVTPVEQLHELRDFRLEPDALVSLNPAGGSERLPWGEVVALVRAVQKGTGRSTEKTTERKFNLGKAVLTGGLSVSSAVTRETSREVDERDPVLFLFRRAGAPWVARESRCRYEGLGAELKAARPENFNTLVRLLRERLPGAPFDDRLMRARAGAEKLQLDGRGAQTGSSNAEAVNLLAPVVAMAVV